MPDATPVTDAPSRRTKRLAALAIVLAALISPLVWWARREPGAPPIRVPLVQRDVRAPEGTRIRVQVLNATATRGLARRVMLSLRDHGFDVVEVGTVPAAQRRDSTLVLDRSGHPEWARLVADALGGARVEARPDSSRYLDVTVLLGASYRAPAEALHP